MSSSRRKIRRKIDFFKVKQQASGYPQLTVDSVFLALKKVGLLLDDERAIHLIDGSKIFHIDSPHSSEKRLILSMSSRSDRPSVESNLTLRDIPIGPNDGISIQTHLVFFPPDLVGVEYRKNGAKIGHLEQLLNKCPEFGFFRFEACLEKNFVTKLSKMKYIDWYSVRINNSQADVIEKASSSIAAGARAELNEAEAESLDLLYRCYTKLPKRVTKKATSANTASVAEESSAYEHAVRKRDQFTQKAKETILFLSRLPSALGFTKVHGKTEDGGAIETFDFMRHKIVGQSRKIKETATFKIDSEDMFSSIVSSYEQLRDRLVDPPTLSP